MFSLGIRKLVVISLVGGIFLLGNIWLVVSWLDEKGVVDGARYIRKEFLTGTAITIAVYCSYCTPSLNCSEFLSKHVLNL